MDLQAAVVGDPVIRGIAQLGLIEGRAHNIAAFEKVKGKGQVTADPMLMDIHGIAHHIIILIHIQGGGIDARMLFFEQTKTWSCSQQVPEIELQYRVVLRLCKGLEGEQLMHFVVITKMLVAGIHEIRFPCFDEVNVIEQDEAAPVLLILNPECVGERQYLLRILDDGKAEIRITHPAVGIVQEALALDVDDLGNRRKGNKKK